MNYYKNPFLIYDFHVDKEKEEKVSFLRTLNLDLVINSFLKEIPFSNIYPEFI